MQKISKALMRPVGRAIADHDMIRHDDHILAGLSGGKDSLSLLHILHSLRQYAPVPFRLSAITVDPMVEGFDPSPLKVHLADLGIPYYFVRQPILERAMDHMDGDSYCSWCARMKRGVMYSTARKHGCNVLALGQHLDDLAESFLLSAFHGGRLKTMKAHYTVCAGDLRVIRPLVYVREHQTREFAASNNLPVIQDNCPACFSMPTQRQHMKELLSAEEKLNPSLFKTLISTINPLIRINTAK